MATAAFRRLSNYENYISLHKIEAKTRRTLNSGRRIAFRSFCESIDRMTPLSRIWRTVHCFKNRFLQAVVASCSADRKVIDKLHLLAEDMCPSGTCPTASYDFHPENFRNNAFLEARFNKKRAVNGNFCSEGKMFSRIGQSRESYHSKLPGDV